MEERKQYVPDIKDVHLLIADDDQDTLGLFKFKLDECGWTGVFVESVSEILDAINQTEKPFDAIITDVNYFNNQPGPRLTGITAAREIRKNYPNVPIIFITAFSNSILREEIRRVKAELVSKPFNYDLLMQRIAELVYWHRLGIGVYKGEDRRQSSVNRSSHYRRATDEPKQLSTSARVKAVLADVRSDSR